MRIILVPDSFKGSLSSKQAAEMMAKGIRAVCPDAIIHIIPVADGGEGTVDAVLEATQAEKVTHTVEDPLGRPVRASFAWFSSTQTAVIEMAEASGMSRLAQSELNPYLASTYGTGQLIKHALDRGAKQLVVGVGGSATVDGGIGCLQALGLECFDGNGEKISRVGGRLDRVSRVDLSALDPRIKHVQMTIASDVTNPLLGPQGAVYVFGPQKGVTEQALPQFEQGMRHYAHLIENVTGGKWSDHPGSGAAGGLGFALLSFFRAEVKSGIELILEVCRFKEYLPEADLVITGEGRLDRQSLYGKGPIGIARMAKQYGVPCIALAGRVEDDLDEAKKEGLLLALPIVDRPLSLEEAMQLGPELIFRASKRLMEVINLSKVILNRGDNKNNGSSIC
jgi:glycerate kinase